MAVQTVLGQVPAAKLGRILTHEHVSIDFSKFYMKPPENLERYVQNKITLQNVGIIRQYPYGNMYNTKLDEESDSSILKEMKLYRQWGGGAIAENTCHGIRRNIPLMKDIQKKTEVYVIAGTGYYVAAIQSEGILEMSVEAMYDVMLTELTQGCLEDPDVKCGFIGEVGSAWPLHDFEKRAIQATGEVQSSLKCPVTFHPGRNPEAPFEILRIFLEAGGKAEGTIMSHLDRTITDKDTLLEFASLGTYCQQDLFGTECSHYQYVPTFSMPSDAQRIDNMEVLLQDGKEKKILISHDIHTKHRLMDFGGHGYSHILNNIIPKLLVRGMTQETVDNITIENPKNWLTFGQK